MKARELIAMLQKIDPDTEIIYCSDTEQGDYDMVTSLADMEAEFIGSSVYVHGATEGQTKIAKCIV